MRGRKERGGGDITGMATARMVASRETMNTMMLRARKDMWKDRDFGGFGGGRVVG